MRGPASGMSVCHPSTSICILHFNPYYGLTKLLSLRQNKLIYNYILICKLFLLDETSLTYILPVKNHSGKKNVGNHRKTHFS